jgi:hypothetical protein
MSIEEIPEPVLMLSGMGVLVLLGVRRHRC